MPFRNDDGIYEEGFIEERRSALEAFVNKIAGEFSHSSLELHILVFGNSLMAWFQVTHLPQTATGVKRILLYNYTMVFIGRLSQWLLFLLNLLNLSVKYLLSSFILLIE